MSKVRLRLIISLSFVLLVAIVAGALLGLPFGGHAFAEATYAPTTIFAQGTGGDVLAPAAAEGETSYITFSFRDEGAVYYRRNLALKWYEGIREEEEDTDDSTLTDEQKAEQKKEKRNAYVDGKLAYFSMTFAFAPTGSTREDGGVTYRVCPQCGKNNIAADAATCPDCGYDFSGVIHFERYEILFESAEENISKDAKATNSIIFVPGENGGLKVGIKNAEAHNAKKDDDKEEDDLADIDFKEIAAENVAEDITIAFSEAVEPDTQKPVWGAYAVTLTVGENVIELGNLTNIGGNYLEYRSSASSTPSTPITFKTELAAAPAASEGQTRNRVNQQVTMKSLNGQGFALNSQSRVKDDTAAVLVVDEEVYAFTLGQRYSLTTQAIDVCDDSVSVDRSFYMYHTDAGEEGAEPTSHIPASEDYATLTTSTYFFPSGGYSISEDQAVSIRYILRDGRFDSSDDYDYVYLTWYAAESQRCDFSNGEKSITCIKVVREKGNPYYYGITLNDEKKINDVSEDAKGAAGDYQTALEKIAGDEKTSAGKGAYIYLPSLRGLIASDDVDYRNLRFNIYYKKENSSTSASSETSLRYNNLRFQIDTEGRYSFKIVASDASGNTMKMYLDEELVTVTSNNVWDIEDIPTFTFEVTYNGADIEDPGEQDPASRGTLYNISDFDIIDLGDSIKEYELYYLDTAAEGFPTENGIPTYSEFVENIDENMTTYAAFLKKIEYYKDDITEDDEDAWNASDNDYLWDPDSDLSFVPQNTGFYIVKLMHYDLHKTEENGKPAETIRYQVIEVGNPYDYIPTKTDWLSNNVTSVILFAISAVLAVIIVILFVVKPSDKTVEEVDLEKLKGKKNNKNSKK